MTAAHNGVDQSVAKHKDAMNAGKDVAEETAKATGERVKQQTKAASTSATKTAEAACDVTA